MCIYNSLEQLSRPKHLQEVEHIDGFDAVDAPVDAVQGNDHGAAVGMVGNEKVKILRLNEKSNKESLSLPK